jgi:hypothetical protein
MIETRNYVNCIELQQYDATSVEPQGQRTIRLPDPLLFSDKDNDDFTFEDWLTRIKGLLDGNADHLTSEKLKLAYVVGRLTGDAAKHTAPRASAGEHMESKVESQEFCRFSS